MPQSSYLQTIARRTKNDFPLLMPPRSPLTRADVPLSFDLPSKSISVQPSDSVGRRLFSPEQLWPSVEAGLAAVSPVPLEADRLNEPKAAPVFTEVSSVSSIVLSSPQQPTSLTPPDSTPNPIPRIQPVQSPDRSVQMSDVAPVASDPQPRSYLQKAARILTPEPNLAFSSGSSAQTVAPAVPDKTIAVPKVSESVVTLQPPRHDSASRSSSVKSQNVDLLPRLDQRPSRTPTTALPANSVHIGTIDIHIASPPPIQPILTAPKPVNIGPLARGFTSGFGLRQG